MNRISTQYSKFVMFSLSPARAANSINRAALLRFYCQNQTVQGATNNFQNNSPFAKTYGQPTSATHPYLIRKNEIIPYITIEEFSTRRRILAENVAKCNPSIENHLIVIPSSSKQYMSDKIPYFFRQNTEFLYLTGCQEPDSCLVITTNSKREPVCTLFLRDKDDHSELWDGPRTGPENGVDLFGVDQSVSMDELETYLMSYSKSKKNSSLWYDFTNPPLPSVHRILSEYINKNNKRLWDSPKGFIQKQRLIKSKAEIGLMQKSCDVASEGIANTIRKSRPGMNEAQIFAQVDYECRMKGAEFLAYPPVVAGGVRANIIHYINNNQIVSDGEMVLMDAGCELHGYSSDITRTWPINGKFTNEQRELYEVVLYTQKELIKLCEPGVTLDKLFDVMCVHLGRGLQEVGLISKSLSLNELKHAAYGFCPHHVSHYLGMDVHDTPLVTRNISSENGMIITIEPGIYIGKKYDKLLPSKYLGVGIRIEDDILITNKQPVVLSKRCPKEVNEIEKLASERC